MHILRKIIQQNASTYGHVLLVGIKFHMFDRSHIKQDPILQPTHSRRDTVMS
jgi:hypothetical protein